nr:hypothetical protein 30 [bacterium]
MKQTNYTSYASGGSFDPVERTTYLPILEENTKRLQESEQKQIDAVAANNRTRVANAGKQYEGLQEIAKFSKTLSGVLIEEQKKENERQMEEGLMMAYTDGLAPSEMAEFDAQESALYQANKTTQAAGAGFEQATNDYSTGNSIRGLSGWRAYGYARGQAEMAGANYPAYYAEAKREVSITLNGREITYDSAQDSAERAAVEAEIRRGYLRRYGSINPALLNKYMFPQMRNFEAQQALEWNEQKNKEILNNRRAEQQDDLFSAVKSGNGLQGAMEFLDTHASDYGGTAGARKVLAQMLEDGLKDGSISPDQIEQLLGQQFQLRNGGGSMTLGQYRDFAGLREAAQRKRNRDIDLELDTQEAEGKQYLAEVRRAMAAKGERITAAEEKAIKDNWNPAWGPIPAELLNLTSTEDVEIEEESERLQKLLKLQGNTLSPDDLVGVDPENYNRFRGYVVDSGVAAGSSYHQNAKAAITSALNGYHKSFDGNKEKTSEWNTGFERANKAFATRFAQLVKAGTEPEDAYNQAIQEIEAKIPTGVFDKRPRTSTGTDTLKQTKKAVDVLIGDRDAWKTTVLPGTDNALKKLNRFVQTGEGGIPQIYSTLARKLNDGTTGFDIANEQYKLQYGKELTKPKAEEAVDAVGPEVQRLLRWKPEPAKTVRATEISSAEGDVKWFLDSIASVESSSYGEYDAFNRGGSNNGYTAHGSGNSQTDLDKPISQMTIGEVIERQKSELWAVGRYQFIPSTLLETLPYTGLSTSDLFDANAQDRFALARAAWRVNVQGTTQGLINEWRGLKFVSEAERQKMLEIAQGFNRPDLMLPALSQ